MYAPMLIPVAALIVGILTAYVGASLILAMIVFLAAVATYITIALKSGNPIKSYRRNPLNYIWIYLLFLGAGILSYDLARPYSLADNTCKVICVSGEVKSMSSPVSGDKALLTVDEFILNDGTRLHPRNCELLLRSDILNCSIGDVVRVIGKITPISDNPNYFSSGYAKRLQNSGILYSCRTERNQVCIIGHNESFGTLAARARDQLETFIEHTKISKDTQNFLITILLGDRSYLSSDVRNLYADAGISHILALSGMHVAIISSILMFLLFPLNFFGYYRYRMMLIALLLIFYAFLTGWSPSTVRAMVMTISYIVCIFLERKNSAWNSLLFATFIILLLNPLALWDIGMQLSFLCVASLIFFVTPLNPFDQHEHNGLYNICRILLTALIATFGTWCVTALYFGRIPILFLISNLLALPLLPAYLSFAIIYLSLAGIGCDWSWLASMIDYAPATLQRVLESLQGESSTSIHFTPSVITVALWLIFLVVAALWINGNRKKYLSWSCIGVLGACIVSATFTLNAACDDFIIQRQITNIQILCRDRYDNIEEKIFERGAISKFEYAGKKMLILDTYTNQEDTTVYDYMILSGGCKADISDIIKQYRGKCLVIHTNIRREREKKIMAEADSFGLRIHSIRHDGPLQHSNFH